MYTLHFTTPLTYKMDLPATRDTSEAVIPVFIPSNRLLDEGVNCGVKRRLFFILRWSPERGRPARRAGSRRGSLRTTFRRLRTFYRDRGDPGIRLGFGIRPVVWGVFLKLYSSIGVAKNCILRPVWQSRGKSGGRREGEKVELKWLSLVRNFRLYFMSSLVSLEQMKEKSIGF